MRRVPVGVLCLLFAVAPLAPGPVASAYEPVNIVHSERVEAGPYGMTIGFSTWPVRAQQSLDFTFIPDGGIADRTGTLSITSPGRAGEARQQPLARHPRRLEVWGLDVRALRDPGEHVLRFRLNGPEGPGEAALTLSVLEQPGPPMALSWAISVLPLVALIALLTTVVRRTRRAHGSETRPPDTGS